MDIASVRDNLARAREEIDEITNREGLPGPVRIIGVTKGHSVEAVSLAMEAGLGDVGENRVQEARGKQDLLPAADVNWHLIGHLQTNKAKLVAGRFGFVHSIDSIRLANAINRACQKNSEAEPLPVLVQVNVAGEEQKGGCAPEDASAIAHHIQELEGLALHGLMTMAPFTDEEKTQRSTFAGLREIRERLNGEGLQVPELSMGMSGDYKAAVAEGATMVRLGTVLFGGRRP
jgi:pyridoxal phosphate enzyme (YggS family)